MRAACTALGLVCLLVTGSAIGESSDLEAQLVPKPPVTQMSWQLGTVRPSGQPVIPMFEGWYANEDGTYDLCFGFFNLNREEALRNQQIFLAETTSYVDSLAPQNNVRNLKKRLRKELVPAS